MEEIIDKILSNEENKNIDFVVHIKNEEELKAIITVLEKYEFRIQLKLFDESLREWMYRTAKEDKFNTCFRIRNSEDDKCVAWNPSIEHWRYYCNDIIELKNGEVIFKEKEYTIEEADIEAENIIANINDGYTNLIKKYKDKNKEQIIEQLVKGL